MSSTSAYRDPDGRGATHPWSRPARGARAGDRPAHGPQPGQGRPSNPFLPAPVEAPAGVFRALLRWLPGLLARPAAGRRMLDSIAMYGTVASPGTAMANAFANEDRLPHVVARAVRVLHQGGTAGEAAERSGLFDPTVVALLTAGERSRRFGAAVKSARSHLEARWRNLRFVGTAFAVLWLELGAALGSVGWLAVHGFPQIRATMAAAPGSPQLLAALERAELANTGLLLVAGFVFASALLASAAAIAGKSAVWLGCAVRLVPGLGPLLESAGLATSCEVAASILRAGLGYRQACQAAAASTVVVRVARFWDTALSRALAGDEPAAAIARPPLQPGEMALIRACRNFSHLGDTLAALGAARAERARTQMQLLASAGGAVLLGFIVLSGVNLLQAYSVQMQSRDVVLDSLSEKW